MLFAVFLVPDTRSFLLTRMRCLGLRTFRPHRNPSPTPRRVRDWTGLHIHHSQAATTRDQGRRQKLDSGMPTAFFPSWCIHPHRRPCDQLRRHHRSAAFGTRPRAFLHHQPGIIRHAFANLLFCSIGLFERPRTCPRKRERRRRPSRLPRGGSQPAPAPSRRPPRHASRTWHARQLHAQHAH